MVAIKIKDNEKMNLADIFNYIHLTTPKNVKTESVENKNNENDELVQRTYTCICTNGEKHELVIDLIDNDTFITHKIYYNTEANVLDLESLL